MKLNKLDIFICPYCKTEYTLCQDVIDLPTFHKNYCCPCLEKIKRNTTKESVSFAQNKI